MAILDQVERLPASELLRLDPSRVEGYVQNDDWVKNESLSRGRIAVYQRDGNKKHQIQIPLDTGLSDFGLLMGQAVVAISALRGKSPESILSELLRPLASDIIRVRELGSLTAQGNIPLTAAREMLNGLKRVVLSAAHSVVNPRKFYAKLSNSTAEEFVDRCLLGQTERGSYVFTVLCPLNAIVNQDPLYSEPFTRKVTNQLMGSLHRLSLCKSEQECDVSLREEDSPKTDAQSLVSANLCEGMIDLMAYDGAAVEIGVDWDSSEPLPKANPVAQQVKFEQVMTGNLQYLATRLRPITATGTQWFYGHVEGLSWHRIEDAHEREGDVVVRVLDAEGEPRNARIYLPANDYKTAIAAHGEVKQVKVRGALQRDGRGFRIMQPSGFGILDLP